MKSAGCLLDWCNAAKMLSGSYTSSAMDQIYLALGVAFFVIVIWIVFHFCHRSHKMVDIKRQENITNGNAHSQLHQDCKCYNCSNWIITKTVKQNQFSLVDRLRKYDPMNIVHDTKHLVSYRTVPNHTYIDCNGVINPNTFDDTLEPASLQRRIKCNIHFNSELKKPSQLSDLDDIVVAGNMSCI